MRKGDFSAPTIGDTADQRRVKIVSKIAKTTVKTFSKDTTISEDLKLSTSDNSADENRLSSVVSQVSKIDFEPPTFDENLFADIASLEELDECEEDVHNDSLILQNSINESIKKLQTIYQRTRTPNQLTQKISLLSLDLASSAESIEWLQDSQLSSEVDFFGNLGRFPSIRHFRESISSVRSIKLKGREGSFVHPLSGRLLEESPSNSAEESNTGIEDEQSAETVKREHYDPYLQLHFMEFSFDDYDSRYPPDPPKPEPKNLIEKWSREPHRESEQPPPPIKSKLRSMKIQNEIERYIEYLIHTVVQLDEQSQVDNSFQEKLDMVEIFNYFEDTLANLKQEEKINKFLDKKGVEYYKRKKTYSYLMDSKDSAPLDVMAKYRQTVTNLDELLGRSTAMEKKIELNIQDLICDEEEEKANIKQEILRFENLVRWTLAGEGNEKFTEIINKELKNMADLRKDISEIRAEVIRHQHTLTVLKMRLTELENLGEGLHLHDYENLHIEAQALDRKIEDRKHDLNRTHMIFQKHLHSIVHFKLKTKMQNEQLQIQSNNLVDLLEEKDLCRKRLFELNRKHAKTRNKLEDQVYHFGLMGKPALLLDYDVTVQSINKRRQNIKELQMQHNELEVKLKSLNMTSNNSQKSIKKKPLRFK